MAHNLKSHHTESPAIKKLSNCGIMCVTPHKTRRTYLSSFTCEKLMIKKRRLSRNLKAIFIRRPEQKDLIKRRLHNPNSAFYTDPTSLYRSKHISWEGQLAKGPLKTSGRAATLNLSKRYVFVHLEEIFCKKISRWTFHAPDISWYQAEISYRVARSSGTATGTLNQSSWSLFRVVCRKKG